MDPPCTHSARILPLGAADRMGKIRQCRADRAPIGTTRRRRLVSRRCFDHGLHDRAADFGASGEPGLVGHDGGGVVGRAKAITESVAAEFPGRTPDAPARVEEPLSAAAAPGVYLCAQSQARRAYRSSAYPGGT